jgi:hypothetical protein
MPKYLVLYRAKTTAVEQMAQSTPEQAQAGMDAWKAWADNAGEGIVDLGAPLSVIEAGGDAGDPVGGYSIMQAESPTHLVAALDGHPHTASGGTIEVLEFLAMPGM